jgi:hypothetical protein
MQIRDAFAELPTIGLKTEDRIIAVTSEVHAADQSAPEPPALPEVQRNAVTNNDSTPPIKELHHNSTSSHAQLTPSSTSTPTSANGSSPSPRPRVSQPTRLAGDRVFGEAED